MMNIEKFEKDMAVFSFKHHQDFLTYLKSLESNGWTIEDAKSFVHGEKERMRKAPEFNTKDLAHIPKCPECNKPLLIFSVNTGPGDQTGDDSKSMVFCTNRECMYTEYSTKTVQEQTKELMQK